MKILNFQNKCGEVAEWFKAAVSKTAILSNRDRGFESHPLRHFLLYSLQENEGYIPILLKEMEEAT